MATPSNNDRNGNASKCNNNKKRKFQPSHNNNHGIHQDLSRGGPGVLLTCEHGREVKCQREGMDMLQHYLDQERQTQPEHSQKDSKPQALDDELAQLKQHSSKQCQDFGVYDLGCRGMALILCKRPHCHLIETTKTTKHKAATDKETPSTETLDAVAPDCKSGELPSNKRVKPGDGEGDDKEGSSLEPATTRENPLENENTHDTTGWDPVPVVETILREAAPSFPTTSPPPPSSRFVSRIIPLQATCFASLDDIEAATKALLQRFLRKQPQLAKQESTAAKGTTLHNEEEQQSTTTTTQPANNTPPTTFGIHVQRRNCSHLTRAKIIDRLAQQVMSPLVPHWKVQLQNPNVHVWVEVCRTTAGVSVFTSGTTKFNLAQARTGEGGKDDK